jgi:hypothetical protein
MAEKKKSNNVVNEIVKKPRGVGKNSPVIGDNGLQVEQGDNKKYLMVSLELANLPDIDLNNPEQVKERITKYFQLYADNDMKPTVAGLGLALNGMDKRRLWEIKVGALKGGTTEWNLPTLVLELIQKAYKILENQWENYMQNGKINPVSGIFLGKNNFGYQDKTEYVVTPNVNTDSDYNADDIKKRYLPDSQLSDDSDSQE